MTLRIDRYAFGRMTVAGRRFTSDLILYPDGRIQDHWWRAQGHTLLPDDIAMVLHAAPRTLVIGTGAAGRMDVSAGVMRVCRDRGIEVESAPTPAAVERFNEAAEAGTSVAGCFHLTC